MHRSRCGCAARHRVCEVDRSRVVRLAPILRLSYLFGVWVGYGCEPVPARLRAKKSREVAFLVRLHFGGMPHTHTGVRTRDRGFRRKETPTEACKKRATILLTECELHFRYSESAPAMHAHAARAKALMILDTQTPRRNHTVRQYERIRLGMDVRHKRHVKYENGQGAVPNSPPTRTHTGPVWYAECRNV